MQGSNKMKWLFFSLMLIALIFSLLAGRKPETLKPKSGNVVEAVYALGTVKTDNTFNLRTSITSKISRIFVTEGDGVYKNTPLILLDSGLMLRAPFSGIINKINQKETENTIPGQAILSLINFEKMHISASLDQESVLKVRKGQKVEISLESMRDKKAKGVVSSVYPSGTEFIAKIKSNDLPAGVLPEMTCDIAIEISKREQVNMIPLRSLNSQTLSLIRHNQKITLKPRLGVVSGEWVEVLNNEVQLTDILLIPKKPTNIRLFFVILFVFLAGITLYQILRKKKEA